MKIESTAVANLPQRKPAAESTVQPFVRETDAAASQGHAAEKAKAKEVQVADDQPTRSSAEDAVKRLAEFVAVARPEISFSIDDASGVQVVKILDSHSREVIRQIPTKEAIQLANALDRLQGLLIKDKA